MSTTKILWITGSCCMLIVLMASLLIPSDVLLAHTPACVSVKRFGRECFMCGSTRSFIQAAQGNFTKAAALNRLAVVLFIIAVMNSIIFIIYFITSNLKNKKS